LEGRNVPQPTDFVYPFETRYGHTAYGIDLRTFIATQVMQGFAADPSVSEASEKALADSAVRWADALIERLNK
jgi:hypothetical protein